MRRPHRVRRHDQRGMTTAAMAFAVGMSFVVLFWATNAIVFWYVKGAVRQSLNEGVHAGLAVGPDGNAVAACNQRLNEALGGLLASSMRSGVTASCRTTGDAIEATGQVRLTGWGGILFGGKVLNFDDTMTRRAPLELNPDTREGI